MPHDELPLLPLLLDRVPPGLVQALGQEGIPFVHCAANPLAGRFVLFDSRLGPVPSLAPGQTALDIDRLRPAGKDDPLELLLDEQAARHDWKIDGLTVTEEIARVDHRAVRQRLLRDLRREIEQAGGVWLCVSAFPFPYRSALNFRIDYDEYEANDVAATLEAIAGNEDATSHFVCGSQYQSQGATLARLRGLDVGSHGYRHHTYLTEAENLENIRRGIDVLRQHGIEPSGFVAPHGRFHRPLLAAMEQLEISHSSEFALAYDDLPFFPQQSRVLQIPIHPVCLGIFLDAVEGEGPKRAAAASQAARTAIEYFEQVVRSKYRAGEPVFVYGHPTGRLGCYPQLLQTVFQAAANCAALWKTTLTGFAQWWRRRAEIRLTVVRQKDQFIVTADGQPDNYRVAVEYWRGAHVARMPLDAGTLRFWPSALAYENHSPATHIRPVRSDRPEGLRGRIRRLIDWEKVTPVEEIPGDNWRNLAKRTLRRLRH